MPGLDLGPVTVGALALAVLTFVVYRSVQGARASHRAGRPPAAGFVALLAVYAVAWIAYGLLIASALAGGF